MSSLETKVPIVQGTAGTRKLLFGQYVAGGFGLEPVPHKDHGVFRPAAEFDPSKRQCYWFR
jgi:hypothetical protein